MSQIPIDIDVDGQDRIKDLQAQVDQLQKSMGTMGKTANDSFTTSDRAAQNLNKTLYETRRNLDKVAEAVDPDKHGGIYGNLLKIVNDVWAVQGYVELAMAARSQMGRRVLGAVLPPVGRALSGASSGAASAIGGMAPFAAGAGLGVSYIESYLKSMDAEFNKQMTAHMNAMMMGISVLQQKRFEAIEKTTQGRAPASSTYGLGWQLATGINQTSDPFLGGTAAGEKFQRMLNDLGLSATRDTDQFKLLADVLDKIDDKLAPKDKAKALVRFFGQDAPAAAALMRENIKLLNEEMDYFGSGFEKSNMAKFVQFMDQTRRFTKETLQVADWAEPTSSAILHPTAMLSRAATGYVQSLSAAEGYARTEFQTHAFDQYFAEINQKIGQVMNGIAAVGIGGIVGAGIFPGVGTLPGMIGGGLLAGSEAAQQKLLMGAATALPHLGWAGAGLMPGIGGVLGPMFEMLFKDEAKYMRDELDTAKEEIKRMPPPLAVLGGQIQPGSDWIGAPRTGRAYAINIGPTSSARYREQGGINAGMGFQEPPDRYVVIPANRPQPMTPPQQYAKEWLDYYSTTAMGHQARMAEIQHDIGQMNQIQQWDRQIQQNEQERARLQKEKEQPGTNYLYKAMQYGLFYAGMTGPPSASPLDTEAAFTTYTPAASVAPFVIRGKELLQQYQKEQAGMQFETLMQQTRPLPGMNRSAMQLQADMMALGPFGQLNLQRQESMAKLDEMYTTGEIKAPGELQTLKLQQGDIYTAKVDLMRRQLQMQTLAARQQVAMGTAMAPFMLPGRSYEALTTQTALMRGQVAARAALMPADLSTTEALRGQNLQITAMTDQQRRQLEAQHKMQMFQLDEQQYQEKLQQETRLLQIRLHEPEDAKELIRRTSEIRLKGLEEEQQRQKEFAKATGKDLLEMEEVFAKQKVLLAKKTADDIEAYSQTVQERTREQMKEQAAGEAMQRRQLVTERISYQARAAQAAGRPGFESQTLARVQELERQGLESTLLPEFIAVAGVGPIPTIMAPTGTATGNNAQRQQQALAQAEARADLYRQKQQKEISDRIELGRAERSLAEEMVQLRAGPGGEWEAAKKIYQLRVDGLRQEAVQTGNIVDLRKNESLAYIEYQKQVAQLEQARVQQVRSVAGGLFDTTIGRGLLGGGTFGQPGVALREMGVGMLTTQARQIFVNTAGELSKFFLQSHTGDIVPGQRDASGKLTGIGRILQGTWLGHDPAKDVLHDPVVQDNTIAIIALTNALTNYQTNVVTSGLMAKHMPGYAGSLPLSRSDLYEPAFSNPWLTGLGRLPLPPLGIGTGDGGGGGGGYSGGSILGWGWGGGAGGYAESTVSYPTVESGSGPGGGMAYGPGGSVPFLDPALVTAMSTTAVMPGMGGGSGAGSILAKIAGLGRKPPTVVAGRVVSGGPMDTSYTDLSNFGYGGSGFSGTSQLGGYGYGFTGDYAPSGAPYGYGGAGDYAPSGALQTSPGGGSYTDLSAQANAMYGGTPAGAPWMTWQKGLGMGAAAVGAGLGAYAGIRQGGVRGGLMAGGSVLGGIGAIMSMIPGGQAVGIPLMIAGMLGGTIPGFMKDPYRVRQQQISNWMAGTVYHPKHDAYNWNLSSSSDQFVDANMQGMPSAFTPLPSYWAPAPTMQAGLGSLVPKSAPNVNIHFNAIDSKSLMDRRADIADVVQSAITQSHPLVKTIRDLNPMTRS